jgi:hypothetical protein
MFGSETLLFLDPSDERWLRFLTTRPEATLFHHPAWINLLATCYRYRPFIIAVAACDGSLRAGLPMMEIHSRITGQRWVGLPFTDHCAPLYCDEAALQGLTDYLVALSSQGVIPRIIVHAGLTRRAEIQAQISYVLHTMDLGPDVDSVTSRFHAMHRRNIKTAEKKGVCIRKGTDREHIAIFYQLHLETRRHQGTPIQPWRFFESVARLIAQGFGFVLLAYKNDVCLAGAVFLHHRQTLIYKYGASRRDALELRPNNLLFANAIRWGAEHAYRVFDLGRTDLTNTGLRDFKSKWGAIEMPLAYSSLPPMDCQFTTSALMTTMQTVIRHSPGWICRVIGELLYRHVA